jgi:hypothetical protein
LEELVKSAIFYHTLSVGFMLIVAFVNLFFIFSSDDFSKKVKMINPIYYMFLAAIGFTGVVILGVNQLHVSHAVWLMIIVFLVIFIMSMKLFKVYKHQSNSQYRTFAKKKYSIDILLILITMSLAYMVR